MKTFKPRTPIHLDKQSKVYFKHIISERVGEWRPIDVPQVSGLAVAMARLDSVTLLLSNTGMLGDGVPDDKTLALFKNLTIIITSIRKALKLGTSFIDPDGRDDKNALNPTQIANKQSKNRKQNAILAEKDTNLLAGV